MNIKNTIFVVGLVACACIFAFWLGRLYEEATAYIGISHTISDIKHQRSNSVEKIP